MLCVAEVAVCYAINTKHIQCGQNVWFLNVKPVHVTSKL